MKKTRKVTFIVLVCLLVFLGGGLIIRQGIRQAQSEKYVQSQTPTLFIHGYGSSYKAEKQMVNAAVNTGVTNNVIRANVNKKGVVTLQGKFISTAINPIVEVNFADNKLIDYQRSGQWLKNVILKLQKTYQIKKFNVVAHSMGNMALEYYMLKNASNKNLPQLQKQVNIAGPFNGVIGWKGTPKKYTLNSQGKPSTMTTSYQDLTKLRKTYPKNQVKVLNIYGNLEDGSNSDGVVSINSARSLEFLIRNRAKTYETLEIFGKKAQHSQLHNNAQVNKALIKFLWKK